MDSERVFVGCLSLCFGLFLALASESSNAQPGTTASQTTTSNSPSTGGGPTGNAGGGGGGVAPIETTLFAYRALGSDADAISGEIAAYARATNRKIVIGTSTDAASFAQWRAIMGEIAVLNQRARKIDEDVRGIDSEYTADTYLLPASLHVVTGHSGSFALGGTGILTITVTDDPLAGTTSGPIVVTVTLPAGLALSASQPGVNPWSCTQSPIICQLPNNTPLQPGDSSPQIQINLNVTSNAQQLGQTTVGVSVSGGGSIAAAVSETITIVRAAAAQVRAAVAPTPPATSPTPPATPFSTALTAIPTFVQLAQFAAQAFAVNETLSPTQGSMTDLPLQSMVARQLVHRGVEAYLPSVYSPRLLRGADLQGTYLWAALTDLDNIRIQMWKDIADQSAKLNDANFVTLNPTKFKPDHVQLALKYAGEAQSLINSAQAVTSNIDSFIASLFGGQAPTTTPAQTPAGSTTPTSNGNQLGNTTNPGTPTSPGGNTSPAGSTTPTTTAQQTTPAFNGTQASTTAPATTTLSAGTGGNILPQILGSDLLAHQIWGDATLDPQAIWAVSDRVNFLALHSLESGGTELIKTNIFFGTHVFFSGGAVLTYSLYAPDGNIVCSGIAYNYKGNVREKDFGRVLHHGPATDAILSPDISCLDFPSAFPAGSPVGEVIERLGLPARVKGSFMEYPNLHLEVDVSNDVVVGVLPLEKPQ